MIFTVRLLKHEVSIILIVNNMYPDILGRLIYFIVENIFSEPKCISFEKCLGT